MDKEFRFEDNSLVRFELLDNGSLAVSMQARHLGKDVKFTSSSTILMPEEVVELINWLGDALIKMEENHE
jgi:hypothetical protein